MLEWVLVWLVLESDRQRLDAVQALFEAEYAPHLMLAQCIDVQMYWCLLPLLRQVHVWSLLKAILELRALVLCFQVSRSNKTYLTRRERANALYGKQ